MKKVALFLMLFTAIVPTKAESLSLAECERLFIKNNLLLLAAQYKIDAQKAIAMQAKVWDNPSFSMEANAYNPDREKYFDTGSRGQKAISVQQLILLGGKRKAQINLANSDALIAEYEYQDLLRVLRTQLRKSYFNIYFDSNLLGTFSSEIEQIDTLVTKYEVQAHKGNISMRDLVRLRALVLNLKNTRYSVRESIAEEKKNLSLLIGLEGEITLEPTAQEMEIYFTEKNFDIENLYRRALQRRYDYKIAQEELQKSRYNLSLQKAYRIPDPSLGVSYDQRGGAFNNQVNWTLSFPLVSWNRNQWNIKASEHLLKMVTTQVEQKQKEIKSELTAIVTKYHSLRRNYVIDAKQVMDDFKLVNSGVLSNFKKQNLTMFEFTDFIESYTSSMIQISNGRKNLVNIMEDLDYLAGGDSF